MSVNKGRKTYTRRVRKSVARTSVSGLKHLCQNLREQLAELPQKSKDGFRRMIESPNKLEIRQSRNQDSNWKCLTLPFRSQSQNIHKFPAKHIRENRELYSHRIYTLYFDSHIHRSLKSWPICAFVNSTSRLSVGLTCCSHKTHVQWDCIRCLFLG